jgi:capsid protein
MSTLLDQYGRPFDLRAMKQAAKKAELRAAYDAAIDTDENRKHWRYADNLSAASANSIEVRRKLRSRARYEALEANSFAKGICLTLSNDTISTGPSLQINLPDKRLRKFIETQWKKWCKATKIHAKLRTARLSKIIDGEVFMMRTNNRRLNTPVQLDIRLIEADQVSTPGFIDGMNPDQVDGIIFEDGQPVIYHVLKGHPGDRWAQLAWQKDDIDAGDMIHMFRSERPGQARGIPEITPALPLFAFLRRYTLATILAAEIAADFAAVLETAAANYDEDDMDDVAPFSNVPIDRGLLTALPRGYKMSQFKPEQPTTSYEAFRNAILQEIARCVHMPANKARADSSAYNYSSGRLDHQTYYEAIAIERSEWEIEALDRIFGWWLDEALMIPGYLDDAIDEAVLASDDGDNDWIDELGVLDVEHEWRWPPHRDVDPSELADVNIALIQAKLKSKRQYWIEQNMDPETIQAEIDSETSNSPDPQAGSNTPPAAGNSVQAESEDPPGEFAGLSRADLKNRMRAIDDAIDRYAAGEWSASRFKVFLRSVGLKEQTIDELLHDCAA